MTRPLSVSLFALFLGCAGTATPGSTSVEPVVSIDVLELTIDEVHASYGRGDFTAVELTRAYLNRIEEFEGHYNAFISLNPNAIADAAALDVEYAATGARGPLHGIPVVLKDNMDYAGLVTTAGYDGFSAATGGIDMVPGDHAAVTDRLLAAGAVVLGKTNLPDFAGHGTRTNSTVSGVTLNPYNVDYAPGGSSGGTATAVNASFAVLGLGTETGGSIQNPAAAQALVGVKPTFGLVPLEGVVPVNSTYVDVVGPLARTVRDAAITLDVLAGPTPEDLATYVAVDHIPELGYASGLNEQALAGKRFGLVGAGWRTRFLPLAPETDVEYRKAIRVLEGEGAEVVEDPFAETDFIELYGKQPRVSTGSHDLFVYFRGLGPGAAFHSIEEWEELSGKEFRRGRRRQPPVRPSATEQGDAYQAWRAEIRSLFRKVLEDNELDGLFFPQAGGPIRPLIENPDSLNYNPNNHPELPSNIINDIGIPVVTVPFSYYENGTPFVLAFIGDSWTEAELLGFAYDFEQATKARIAPTLVPKPSPSR
jgi:amidase